MRLKLATGSARSDELGDNPLLLSVFKRSMLISLLEKLFKPYGTPSELGCGRFSEEKFVAEKKNVFIKYLQTQVTPFGTHHVRKTGDLWHCGDYGEVAYKEFYKPDECRRGEVHWIYCSGCFQAITAKLEQELHVRGLSVELP